MNTPHPAMDLIAASPRPAPAAGRFGSRSGGLAAAACALLLAACSSLPARPAARQLYDFGPPAADAAGAASPVGTPGAADPSGLATSTTSTTTPGAALATVALAEVDTTATLDGTAVLYRLAYDNANQLQPYAHARWAAPPAQLLRQRIRDRLAARRVVLDASESALLRRTDGRQPRVLRLQLEEFAQVFDSATQSQGVLRLRATLAENAPDGERLLGQRLFTERRPAPSADAAGGVRALTTAADAVAAALDTWLAAQESAASTAAASRGDAAAFPGAAPRLAAPLVPTARPSRPAPRP